MSSMPAPTQTSETQCEINLIENILHLSWPIKDNTAQKKTWLTVH